MICVFCPWLIVDSLASAFNYSLADPDGLFVPETGSLSSQLCCFRSTSQKRLRKVGYNPGG